MLKDRIIVADGAHGWEVRLYAKPGWQGDYSVLANDLSEEDADNFVAEYCDKAERRTLH